MGALHAHSLELLSADDCLSVFAQHALGARDFEGHPSLKEVAEKIVRKCNGLPLAAKTLGGLLRFNVDLHAWEDIVETSFYIGEGTSEKSISEYAGVDSRIDRGIIQGRSHGVDELH
ncbi:hypothetical protein PVK06_036157 [Gossypium arboreum]|uniref:NB-ARC domain-containing protein n=2 Tax=Gossypium arboreum TaxID=29729 RepID=A0ABR0NIQ6_GOSAR|nr:hypothetical protein PVK06_036157 [Gossypium arboreum]